MNASVTYHAVRETPTKMNQINFMGLSGTFMLPITS
jgi:hypothetical protein